MGLKIFLGSPCYDTMEPEFVGSLIASMDMLRDRGHEVLDNDATTSSSTPVAVTVTW